MGKLFKILSTLMICVGLLFLFLYVKAQGTGPQEILNNPSYYVAQNYWFVFLSGIAVLAFSVLGSFFSWFRNIDAKEQVLPNAGYSSSQHIDSWLQGSTADSTAKTGSASGVTGGAGAAGGSRVPGGSGIPGGMSVGIPASALPKSLAEETEVKFVPKPPRKTEELYSEEPETPTPEDVVPAAPETELLPETTTPEVAPKDAIAPETGTPEVTCDDALAPETTTPEVTPVDALVPETDTPEVEPDDAIAPETTTPEVAPVDALAPETDTPEVAPEDALAPETTTPEVAPEEAPPVQKPKERKFGQAPETEELYREPENRSGALPTEDLSKGAVR